MGFCVATTKNGRSSGSVRPPTVTLYSCMASSSADWVLGGVRLISSARTTLAKIGPGTKRSRRAPVVGSVSNISVPRMSPGIRSGVNWIRRNSQESACASVRTSSVLARPGTPMSRQCPRAKRAISRFWRMASCPTMTLRISASSRSCCARIRSGSAVKAGVVSVIEDVSCGMQLPFQRTNRSVSPFVFLSLCFSVFPLCLCASSAAGGFFLNPDEAAQIQEGNRRDEEEAVESVERAAVPRHDRAEVLDADLALERRLKQVADLPDHACNRPNRQTVYGRQADP